jgi:hypothetical protein
VQEYIDPERTEYNDRKSPAALFGSKKIGAVVLPEELQQAIRKVIDSMFDYFFEIFPYTSLRFR